MYPWLQFSLSRMVSDMETKLPQHQTALHAEQDRSVQENELNRSFIPLTFTHAQGHSKWHKMAEVHPWCLWLWELSPALVKKVQNRVQCKKPWNTSQTDMCHYKDPYQSHLWSGISLTKHPLTIHKSICGVKRLLCRRPKTLTRHKTNQSIAKRFFSRFFFTQGQWDSMLFCWNFTYPRWVLQPAIWITSVCTVCITQFDNRFVRCSPNPKDHNTDTMNGASAKIKHKNSVPLMPFCGCVICQQQQQKSVSTNSHVHTHVRAHTLSHHNSYLPSSPHPPPPAFTAPPSYWEPNHYTITQTCLIFTTLSYRPTNQSSNWEKLLQQKKAGVGGWEVGGWGGGGGGAWGGAGGGKKSANRSHQSRDRKEFLILPSAVMLEITNK